MVRRSYLAALISIAAAAPAVAQSQGAVPRAIALPDTMGANFAVADTLTGRSEPTDYDFLIGTWRFTFQNRRPDGSFGPLFTGHCQGCAVHCGYVPQTQNHPQGDDLVGQHRQQ